VLVDRDGKVVRRIDTSGRRIDRVVFAPSARFLAGSGREANVVLVWETATGRTVAVFGAGKIGWWSGTVDVAFSNDERYFVATAPGKLQFWEVNGGRRAEGLGDNGSGMAFSPDSRMMACGSGNETLLWEVPTRKLRVKLGPTGDWNPALRFLPDGRLLARRTSTGAVKVWDLLRGRQVANFQGHEGSVLAFAFTGDGRHLITASDDCTLLVWDLAGPVAAARAGQKAPLRKGPDQ
jgi:WD40 repeat protein